MKQLKIGKLITNRETLSLSKYLFEVAQFELITAEEEVELTKLVKTGDKNAVQKMITANLRFVVSVAKQYQNQGLPLADLINEGNLGLIKAVQKYDETRGFKFISYAVWWIRQSILQALADHARIVRLPANKIGSINMVNKTITRLEQEYQREPTIDEVAFLLETSTNVVENVIQIHSYQVSMDAPFSDDEGNTWYDLMLNQNSPSPDKELIKTSLTFEIDRTLSKLDRREADVIRYFYGLNGLRQHTLEEIGYEFELSRERVRQIKEKAIKKMRNNHRNMLLRTYLG
jgi:RNA polymerase primary sigma factor